MTYSIVKRQVREVNRKLFATDRFYLDDDDSNEVFVALLTDIIQTFSPDDMLSNTPTILEVKDNNITEQTLDKLMLLSKKSVYIQFNNRSLADSSKLNIIRKLKDTGYKIIIEVNRDDTMFNFARILADIIKINIREVPQTFQSVMLQNKLLAYNIDTPEDYVMAESIGISLYEGEYIGESTNFTVPVVRHSNVGFIQLLALMNTKQISINEVIELIRKDSLLTAQVFRLANSKYYKGQNVQNSLYDIGEAIVRIGLQNLKRWLLLLEFGRNDNANEELLKASYYRAILCENIVHCTKRTTGMWINAREAYMIGLLSYIDILESRPMANAISNMNLTSVIEYSLVYKETAGGIILKLVTAFEEHNDLRVNDYCKMLGLPERILKQLHTKSMIEAANVWKDITEYGGIYL